MEFWELTPFELNCFLNGFTQRKKIEIQQRISIAYTQAYWTVQWLGKSKPKPLKKILQEMDRQQKAMTDDEMLAKVKQLNAMFGGEIKDVKE